MAWERLAHVALSGTATSIDSGTFTAKKNLKVIVYAIQTGGAIEPDFRFYNCSTLTKWIDCPQIKF